jgi:manganese/iron transport system ATP-binding protein
MRIVFTLAAIVLSVNKLGASYAGNMGIEEIDFRVYPGQVMGIVGPNGAGKSTLLKAMLGLIPSVSGTVHYCDCPLHRQLERVAYVPQRSQIDWDYPVTVEEVVMMARTRSLGWFRRPGRVDRRLVMAALEKVDLWDLRDRRIGELSGGQQQRTFLARALAQEADVLLFDEPFTGIDKPTEGILLQVFEELRGGGKIVMLSTHEWGHLLQQLDRMLLLNKTSIADGTPQQVMTSDNLVKAFGTALSFENHGKDADLEVIC